MDWLRRWLEARRGRTWRTGAPVVDPAPAGPSLPAEAGREREALAAALELARETLALARLGGEQRDGFRRESTPGAEPPGARKPDWEWVALGADLRELARDLARRAGRAERPPPN